jgi:hypothetical protein
MSRRTVFLSLLCSAVAWAGPCVVGSLNSYEQLGGAGCTIGALRYFNFTFGVNVIGFEDDTQILVTPISTPGSPGLDFSQFFPVTNSSVTFSINYSIDPPPIIVRQFVDLDPPLLFSSADFLFCVNQLFGGGANCADNTAPFDVHVDNSNPPASNGSIFNFPTGESTLDTRTTLTIGNGSGTSSIDDLIEQTNVTPEPATLGLTAAALLGLAALQYKLRKRAAYKSIAP